MKKVLLMGLTIAACAFKKDSELHLKVPRYAPRPIFDFKKTPLQPHSIELGRTLFYDPLLSADSTVSCASCHSPYNAFAHTDHNLSHGIGDKIGTRNAPAIFNVAWQNTFMWDGAINHIDMQALAPISHPKEMGTNINTVVGRLQSSSMYRQLFKSAFGDTAVTGERTLKALAQFELTLVSFNAKYDRVKQGKEKYTPQEQNGYTLFVKHCNSCHSEPLFSNYQFACNGLPVDTNLKDWGRWNVTHESKDSLQFKIPSLRNLSYSYPYMHDGRFKKIGQVIAHYTSGIKTNNSIAPQLKQPILLNEHEKTDLIAFLLTLNDSSFIFNRQYHFPPRLLPQNEGKRK